MGGKERHTTVARAHGGDVLYSLKCYRNDRCGFLYSREPCCKANFPRFFCDPREALGARSYVRTKNSVFAAAQTGPISALYLTFSDTDAGVVAPTSHQNATAGPLGFVT